MFTVNAFSSDTLWQLTTHLDPIKQKASNSTKHHCEVTNTSPPYVRKQSSANKQSTPPGVLQASGFPHVNVEYSILSNPRTVPLPYTYMLFYSPLILCTVSEFIWVVHTNELEK